MLKSKRQLQGFIPKSSLKDFIGIVKGYTVLDRTGSFAKPGQKVVAWEFTDIEVMDSDEPYDLKTAVIGLNYSDALNSGYVAFEDTVAEAFDVPEEEACIDLTVGARIHVTREDNHLFFIDKNKKESRGVVWHVAEVVGKAKKAAPALDVALSILNGKTADEFLKESMADITIKKDAKLCQGIISGAFLKSSNVTTAFDVVNSKYIKKV